MNTIKVTVGNHFFHGVIEEFICSKVDISDLEEMEYCAEECVGQYMDMHEDMARGYCPDISYEDLVEACYYSIEEVIANEL